MGGGRWYRLVGAANLAQGELRRVRVGERELVLVNDADAYFALDGHCTHKPEALLAEGMLFLGTIICPWHGFRYDVRTGRNVHPGEARPLGCVPVRVEGRDLLLDLGVAAETGDGASSEKRDQRVTSPDGGDVPR